MGAMQEATQRDIEEIEEESEESMIEKLMDKNGKKSKFLSFNLYRKIIRHMKEIYKPSN